MSTLNLDYQVLRAIKWSGGDGDPHLIISRDNVAFNTAVPHTLDTAHFESLLQASRTPGSTRFDHLAEAAALVRGDFLAGFFVRDAPEFEEWLLAQRVRYRELALHTLHTLTDYHLSRGEYGRAIDTATRLLALDGWREEAHRQLMLALARSGQRTAALTQYETCRRLLKEELDVPPPPPKPPPYMNASGPQLGYSTICRCTRPHLSAAR